MLDEIGVAHPGFQGSNATGYLVVSRCPSNEIYSHRHVRVDIGLFGNPYIKLH